MQFMETQTIKGKDFTNSRFDAELVARILVAMEREESLRKRLTATDTAGVKSVFDACSFDRCAQEELENVVSMFSRRRCTSP